MNSRIRDTRFLRARSTLSSTAGAAALLALLAACGAARGAVINSQWTNLAPLPSDTWGVAANWSPAVVPDNGADTYNVFIDLNGSYAVVLDQNRTVDSLTFTAVGARLELFDGTTNALTILGDYTQGGDTELYGDFAGPSAQSTMSVGGNALIQGGSISRLTSLTTNQDLHFFAASKPIEIGDCAVVHNGTTGQWSGGSDLFLNSGATLTLSAASTFTINATGNIGQLTSGAASIVNNGTLVKASAGTNTINDADIALSNAVGATINVQSGELATSGAFTNTGTLRVSNASSKFNVTSAANFTNFAGGTLTGGTYDLTGTFQFNAADIQNVAADVTLTGASAKISDHADQDGLRNAAAVNAGGALKFNAGANFAPAGNFDVQPGGLFNVGAGSRLTVATGTVFTAQAGSTFTNIAGTTAGGEILVRGQVRTPTASITTVNSKLTLDGNAASVTNLSNVNALGNLATIGATGNFSVLNRATPFVTNAAVFNVATGGHLTVGSGVTFDIPSGTLGNLTSATLDLGRFTLQGRVRTNLPAPGSIPALTLNNTTTLDGVGSSIFDITTNFDLFSRLSVIDTGGDLSLLNGRALALTQPLTVRGRLFIGNTTAPRPAGGSGGTRGSGTEEVLAVEGDVTQETGFSSFDSGRLRITGPSSAFRVVAGGVGGSGTVEGNTVLGGTASRAFIAPGAEGPCNFGTLNLLGNLQLRTSSAFEFDLGHDDLSNAAIVDQLLVLGVTTIDPGVVPAIAFHICDDFVPNVGDTFLVANLNMASAISFSYTGLSKPNGITITPVWASGDLYVRVLTVPAPGLAAPLGVLALAARRRR